MSKEEMMKRISELESINDQLQAEIRYLDKLLKKAGFVEGIKTMKSAAEELIIEQQQEDSAGF